MNFAPYLSLPPWRAVSINNTWELGESIRGYPCGEESDGGWAPELLGRERVRRLGWEDGEEQKDWVPLLFIEELFFGGGEVSGVAHVMHHGREKVPWWEEPQDTAVIEFIDQTEEEEERRGDRIKKKNSGHAVS